MAARSQRRAGARRAAPRRRSLCARAAIASALAALVLCSSSLAAEAPGKISGNVSDASAHAPIEGIEVCAFSTDMELLDEEEFENAFKCVETGAGGEYLIAGLQPESYFVEFAPPFLSHLDYIGELYDNTLQFAEATPVLVESGTTTPGIDAELAVGGEIAGTLTAAPTGLAIANAGVCAVRLTMPGQPEVGACAQTGAAGEYTVRGLPTGNYRVLYVARGFGVQYYDGKLTEAEAEPVSVVAPGLTAPIDDAMTPSGTSGSPLGPLPVEAAPGASPLAGSLASKLPFLDATLSLAGARVAIAHGGDARVRVGCAGTTSCSAKLSLLIERNVKINGHRTRRELTLGTSRVLSIAAGRKVIAAIELNPLGRRLLGAGSGRLRVELSIKSPGRLHEESVTLLRRTRRTAQT